VLLSIRIGALENNAPISELSVLDCSADEMIVNDRILYSDAASFPSEMRFAFSLLARF
jgi:hypothetical protein